MSTWEKYKSILTSVRFHQLLAGFIIMVLAHYGVIDTWLSGAIASLLGVSIGIGTVDAYATKRS